MEETSSTRQDQLSFKWNPGEKVKFDEKLRAWQEISGMKGTQREYVLWLIDQADRQGRQSDLQAKLRGAGIDQILDAFFVRRAADERLIEQIADVVREARDKAEADVQGKLARLELDLEASRKSLDRVLAEKSACQQEAQEAAAKAKQRIEGLEADLRESEEALVQEQESRRKLAEELGQEKEKAESLAENLTAELDKARQEAGEAKERARSLESELTQTRNALVVSQTEALEAKTVRDKVAIELEAARQEIARQENNAADLARMVEDQKSAADQAEARIKELDASLEVMRSELEEERRKTAGLDARAASQSETIAALREAIAAIRPQGNVADKPVSEGAVSKKGSGQKSKSGN